MSVAEFIRRERAGIADDLERFGPNAPTLCEGWTTRDLLAHLLIREHDLVAAPGILLPGPFAAHTAARMRVVAADDYYVSIARFRAGPGPLMRFVPAANVNEYFVHHEDIRRANGEGPRSLDASGQGVLWSVLGAVALQAKVKLRAVGVVIDGGSFGRRVTWAKDPAVVLRGDPSELVLYLMGRRAVAHVTIDGDPIARAALEAATLGF